MSWTFYSNGGIKTSPTGPINNAVKAYKSGSQAITAGTWTSLTFDVESYDYGNLHSISSNTSRLTAQVDGIYTVTGFVQWEGDTSNDRGVRIIKNGGEIQTMVYGVTSSTAAINTRQSLPADVYLAAGDYVELQVWHNVTVPDTSLNVTAAVFSMSLVSPPLGGGSGGLIQNLTDLGDVTISSPAEGDVLTYDGADWVKSNPVYGCRVRRTTDQTATTSGTTYAISFDSSGEDWDPQDMWDVANPTRVTIQKAGIYVITGCMDWDPNATGVRGASIRIDGSNIVASSTQVGSATTSANRLSVTSINSLGVGQYVELTMIQTSGGSLDVNTLANYSPMLSVVRVGSLT